MDYLKNVIFQYITFPIHAPERHSLVPVIAMLLQFSPPEMTKAMKATQVSLHVCVCACVCMCVCVCA
jgi:hypothetical protein